jgi:maleamate amidohydrolase
MKETNALVVVDMQRGYTDVRLHDSFPNAYPVDSGVVENVHALVDFAHFGRMPVFFTVIAFSAVQLADNLWFKHVPQLGALRLGTPLVEVDPRLGFDTAKDLVFNKQYPSAFTSNDFLAALVSAGIGRCIFSGITMSGCVLASVMDALPHGIVPVVVRDAVADRSASLRDIALDKVLKTYGKVWNLNETFLELS